MKQIFDQFLQILQQAIAAIFRFIQLIWTWSADQITKIAKVPWDSWPIWKQILLVIVIAAVAYLLFVAARQLPTLTILERSEPGPPAATKDEKSDRTVGQR